MTTPTSVRDDPGSLELVPVASAGGLQPAVLTAARKALVEQGSVGVIVPDGWAARTARLLTDAGIDHQRLGGAEPVPDDELPPRVSLVPATTAKGLEFDRVVVVEPAQIAADEPDVRTGLRRLYVVLTRAVSGLAVVHHQPLPGPLGIR
jgi:hypothetical protein